MGGFVDLTGQRFGKLTVIQRDFSKKTDAAYWICQCECGNRCSVRSDRLKKGEKTNCGCIKISRKIDTTSLVGKKFGRLTVLERDLTKPIGKGHDSYWICQCECGNKKSICRRELIEGKTKSCGCLKKELLRQKNTLDLTNQRFGKLVALKNTGELKHNSYIWFCKCDCGNYHLVNAESLQSGKVNSCGLCHDTRSFGEQKVIQILEQNKIPYKMQYSFNDCRNPETNRKLLFDFAIFSKDGQLDRLIEYDGEQHFRKEGLYCSEKNAQRDCIKNQYCREHSIKLVRIPYTQYKNLSLQMILGDEFLI